MRVGPTSGNHGGIAASIGAAEKKCDEIATNIAVYARIPGERNIRTIAGI
jgi:hypothetical protein